MVEKKNDAVLASVSDCITSLLFLIGLYVLEHYEREEKKILEKSFQRVEDYCVTITNLPNKKEYGSLENLKSLLFEKLTKVMNEEKKKYDKFFVYPEQLDIISINFGLNSYENFQYYAKIKRCIETIDNL